VYARLAEQADQVEDGREALEDYLAGVDEEQAAFEAALRGGED
jgi:hypothetical protein